MMTTVITAALARVTSTLTVRLVKVVDGWRWTLYQNQTLDPIEEDCGEEDCPDDDHVEAWCPNCDEGRVECTNETCDGGYQQLPETNGRLQRDWTSELVCQDFILEYLSQYGLARRIETSEDREMARHRTNGNYRNWTPAGALKFCLFYRDPSVDSECTMTLSMATRENILLLPRLVEAFNALGVAVGHGVNIDNAGMHMALLSDVNCRYSRDDRPAPEDAPRFENFKRAMVLLQPALYFLGATCETTRQLHFREPGAARGKKFSAIHYVGTSLEFRVFDPCYTSPETVLDNFVVMKNCVRYWNDRYIDPRLDKIANNVRFGVDNSQRTDRFYTSIQPR
jgi:hypothetical protein